MRAYIALGANLGDTRRTLETAAEQLGTLGVLRGVSRLYRTAPVGGPLGQPEYLNAAVSLDTDWPAAELLVALHQVEAQAGRVRAGRWGARTLDLDLICYGEQVCGSDTLQELTLPHPRAWERTFVLWPLADLDPDLRHPVTGESVMQALGRLAACQSGPVDTVEWAAARYAET
ncbi:2-amino-4-hydroxy-6-hydroxymethyldihydropteridine diphosphokinase [Deinococcus lacus]|uniref:2-amino-4-hydroxy-6-hydroxymethyldihydropteridine diphosphokinase n=1 Tax=Deinococcus lacus TaxID=392561 RepID=A0ABW1YBP6_9DEIO